MNDSPTLESTGQVTHDAAQLYERYFVPALFQQWTGPVLDAAGVGTATRRMLDVACGTGVLARAAAARIGADGVAGLDPNEGMLAVARGESPAIDWRTGCAEALPFEDHSFDAVTCQFGLMFFTDQERGLREMLRVLRAGGRLAVAVWDEQAHAPGFADLTRLLDRIVGREAGDALRAPFSLGNVEALRALFRKADIEDPAIATHRGTARFPTMSSWIHTNVRGWSFSDLVDDAQLAQLLEAAQREMSAYVGGTGEVAFDAHAHIVAATRH